MPLQRSLRLMTRLIPILLLIPLCGCTIAFWRDAEEEEARQRETSEYVKRKMSYCSKFPYEWECKSWLWNGKD